MYSKILVPLDGSRSAESILPYVRLFAETLKVPVELISAIDPRTPDGFGSLAGEHARYHDVQVALPAKQEKSCDYLKKTAFCLPDSLAVDCTVEVGKPARVIIEKAAAVPGTLIAMATHGHSGVKRWVLGGMAEKVLRRAANDLLLFRAAEETSIFRDASLKSIILPLDGSETPAAIIPDVVELAKEMSLEILLLRAFGVPMAYRAEDSWSDSEWILELVKDVAREDLEAKLEEVKTRGWNHVTPLLLEGNAVRKVIDEAQKDPQKLVAVSRESESLIARWLSGGVPEDIIGYTGGPVLVFSPSIKRNNDFHFPRRFFRIWQNLAPIHRNADTPVVLLVSRVSSI